ncbi:hypothetical protein [Leifsonia xyli]|uniref:hypothetical protein n=1 Tax=Leifsonia xyli TaxID=1575 RepID=UPI003D669AEF
MVDARGGSVVDPVDRVGVTVVAEDDGAPLGGQRQAQALVVRRVPPVREGRPPQHRLHPGRLHGAPGAQALRAVRRPEPAHAASGQVLQLGARVAHPPGE